MLFDAFEDVVVRIPNVYDAVDRPPTTVRGRAHADPSMRDEAPVPDGDPRARAIVRERRLIGVYIGARRTSG